MIAVLGPVTCIRSELTGRPPFQVHSLAARSDRSNERRPVGDCDAFTDFPAQPPVLSVQRSSPSFAGCDTAHESPTRIDLGIHMPRRIRHYGIFDFPWHLPVCTAALGIKETVRIGGHDVELSFPQAGNDFHVFPPKDGIPQFLSPPAVPRSPFRRSPWEWGRRAKIDSHYISAAAFSTLLHFDREWDFQPEFDTLKKGFTDWFQIVQDWAAAWTGAQPGAKISERGSSLRLYAQGKSWTDGGTITIHVHDCDMTERQLRGALQRASRGEQLPIEHRMLLSARSASATGDYRKSVIDAATGVEVALASHISSYLASRQTPQEFIDKMIVDVNGLASLFALCIRLGWESGISQPRLNNELTYVRNKAAHAGYTPTSDEARTVRAHATSIVKSLRPLPEY